MVALIDESAGGVFEENGLSPTTRENAKPSPGSTSTFPASPSAIYRQATSVGC